MEILSICVNEIFLWGAKYFITFLNHCYTCLIANQIYVIEFGIYTVCMICLFILPSVSIIYLECLGDAVA